MLSGWGVVKIQSGALPWAGAVAQELRVSAMAPRIEAMPLFMCTLLIQPPVTMKKPADR